MDNNGSRLQAKTCQLIGNALLEQLRHRQIEWIAAHDPERDAALRRFLEALQSVDGFLHDCSAPKDQ